MFFLSSGVVSGHNYKAATSVVYKVSADSNEKVDIRLWDVFVKFRNGRDKSLYENVTDLEGLDKSSNNLVKASNGPIKYNVEGKGNSKKM